MRACARGWVCACGAEREACLSERGERERSELLRRKAFFFMEHETESEVGVGVSWFHEEDPWPPSFPVFSTKNQKFFLGIFSGKLPFGVRCILDTMRAVCHADVSGGLPSPILQTPTPGG